MELEIFNENFESIGIVDNYQSVIWHRKYFEAGVFEIYAGATKQNINLLKTGYFVTKNNSVECGLIEVINISKNEDDTEYITASGHFLTNIFNSRIINFKQSYNTQTELIMRDLVDKCIINNINTDCNISNLELGNLNDFTDVFECYVDYNNLGQYLTALAKVSNIGYRLKFDNLNKKLIFETYKGIDRSINQSINPQVVFSQEYDNLLTSNYTKDTTTEVNTVIARYSGTMGEVIVEVNNGRGIDRKEKYIKGNCVTQTKYFVDTEGNTQSFKTIDVEATKKALQAQAQQALYPIAEKFEGSVDFKQGYKTDYDLGDIITIFNNKWDVSISTRIYEIQEVYDENGIQVIPVFGTPQKTLSDILKG